MPENSRRHFLRLGLTGAALTAAAGVHADHRYDSIVRDAAHASPERSIAFYGRHQAGITTPVQKHLYFFSADLHSRDREKIRDMFARWTDAAAALTRGEKSRPYGNNVYLPPADTGEADSLHAHRLTLTFGIGPGFFDKLDLARLRPQALKPLPHFPRDQLQSAYSGGDLCIQACADDPQVAFHAVRNLVRSARTLITPRWAQPGFNAFDHPDDTPRNLFAFKDGTANKSGAELEKIVWIDDDDLFSGGSYLIARRIKMFTETWDRTALAEQERTFGRHRDSGAAFGQTDEHDPVNLTLENERGEPLLPADSHVRLAHAAGHNILRRSYSYVGGIDAHGQFDTGLMFLSFQKNPQAFIDIQNALGNSDKLNEYITHQGSAVFLCFPGVSNAQDRLGSRFFAKIGERS